MPTSAPGNSRPAGLLAHRRRGVLRHDGLGFTLIELMVVMAVIAIGVAVVTLALRDPAATRLEREAQRLAALLEIARAESRATGVPALWIPSPAGEPSASFRFVGLRAGSRLPETWLDDGVRAEVAGGRVVLGPDAILPPQRIVLALGEQRMEIASDGLGAFSTPVPQESAP